MRGAGVLAAAALAAGAAEAQMIGDDLAATLEAMDCAAPESDLFEAFEAEGWHVSDFQAQAMALYRRGHLASDGEGRLRLVNWGACA